MRTSPKKHSPKFAVATSDNLLEVKASDRGYAVVVAVIAPRGLRPWRGIVASGCDLQHVNFPENPPDRRWFFLCRNRCVSRGLCT
jgi:hypothetical protein